MRIIFSTILSVLLLCLTSCSSDITDGTINNDGTKTCRMHFNGEFSTYGDEPSSRAAVTIPDNATMYVYFKNGSTTIPGTAVYHSTQGEWSITFEGSLASSSTCTLYYIVNPGTVSGSEMTIDSSTEVYSTTAGTYTYSTSEGIVVTAKLTPALSRVRFQGTANTFITVSGAKIPKTFDTSKGTLTETIAPRSLTVASTGYTPYMYHNGASATDLSIIHSSKMFTIKNPLAAGGKTGYIILPTEASHNGWTMTDKPAEPEYVDLGLSVKWATFNVGASRPEEYGDYYAWGETEPYYTGNAQASSPTWKTGKSNGYKWASYKWCNGSYDSMTKYCTSSSYGTVDNKSTLELSDDAARTNWGGTWRMPTITEQQELQDNCYWEWTDSYNSTGVKGYIVYKVKNAADKGKHPYYDNGYYDNGCITPTPTASYSLSDNHIFLPAAGYRYDTYFNNVASYGVYWSSSLNTSNSSNAYILYFDSGSVSWLSNYRCDGRSVRAVCP